MGSQAERTLSKVVVGGPSKAADCGARQARQQLADPARWQLMEQAVPHSHADKLGGTTREQDRPRNPGFQRGKKVSNH